MYKNLRAEMARNGIDRKHLAVALSISEKTVSNKLNGITTFTIPESIITDKRFDASLCGIVVGVINQIDFITITTQFTSFMGRTARNKRCDLNE